MLRHITGGTNDIACPIVTGLADSTIENTINGAVHELVFAFVDSITDDFEHTDRSADPRDPQLEIWVENLIGVNACGVLSMKFTLSWYAGGAHPMSYLRALTFDLTTGHELALSDLFANDIYIQAMSGIVKEGFAQSDTPMLEEFVSIDPDNEYYLTGEGIVIFYQRYEYTPYAYGFPEFTFPYDEAEAAGLIPKLAELAKTLTGMPPTP